MLLINETMPESCSECFACRQDSIDGLRAWRCNLTLITFVGREEFYTKRDEECPLIEVKEDVQ